MCIYMYVYVYIHVYVYIYTQYLCICMYIYIIPIYTHTPIRMMYICIHIFSIRIIDSCLYNYPFIDESFHQLLR